MIGQLLRIRYEVVEELSKGAIFDVFLARDRLYGREVTIRVFKEPFAREPDFVSAVKSTVNKYAEFQGLGLESSIEVDDHEGLPFIVCEHSNGQPLQDRIEKLAPFSVSVSVSTAISICEALSPLHSSGLAHGDLTAQNIVALPDGQCRLQMAGMWESYSSSQTAGVLALPGMAASLAPEVSAGSMPSPTSDVYSVGVLLYQLLSGRLPYSADTPVAMAIKHATSAVPSVRIFNSAVPTALDDIIKRCLAKEPAARFQNAAELLSDLRILQDGLRFGKPVNWPVKKTEPEKQPVAPKMSAIRDVEKDSKKKSSEPRDVPVWLMVCIAFFGAVVLSLLGVWIVFNMSQPKLVVVPNVKGAKLAEARKTLEGLKLKIRIIGKETSETIGPDTILDMMPAAGRKLHEGSMVGVKISTGSRYVELPDLKGVTMDKARSMLEALNLTLDPQVENRTDPEVEAGLIISQSPESRRKVDRFTKVYVVVSSGKTGLPNSGSEDQQYLYTLKIGMTNLQESVVLRVDITDDHGTRTIYEQPHEPNDIVEVPTQGYGKQAKFSIYYDNVLVSEREQQAEEKVPTP